jgi:hypothetical protein
LWELVGISVRQAPKAENGFSMLKRRAKASTQKAQKAQKKPKARRKKKARR